MESRSCRLNQDSSLRIKTPPGLPEPKQDLELPHVFDSHDLEDCTCNVPRLATNPDYLDKERFMTTPLVCPVHPTSTTTLKLYVCGLDLNFHKKVPVHILERHIDMKYVTYESMCFFRSFISHMFEISRKTRYVWDPRCFAQNNPIIVNWNFNRAYGDYTRVRDFTLQFIAHDTDLRVEDQPILINARLNRTYLLYPSFDVAIEQRAVKFALCIVRLMEISIDSRPPTYSRHELDMAFTFLDLMRDRFIDGYYFEDSVEPIVLDDVILRSQGVCEHIFLSLWQIFEVDPFDRGNFDEDPVRTSLLKALSINAKEVFDPSDIPAIINPGTMWLDPFEYERDAMFGDIDDDDDDKSFSEVELERLRLALAEQLYVDEQCEKRVIYEPKVTCIGASVIVIALLGFALGVNFVMHMLNGNIDRPTYHNWIPEDDAPERDWINYRKTASDFVRGIVPPFEDFGKISAITSLIADTATVVRVIRLGDFWATFGTINMYLGKDNRILAVADFKGWLSMVADQRASDLLSTMPNSNAGAVSVGFAARAAVKKHVLHTGGNPRKKFERIRRFPHQRESDDESDYESVDGQPTLEDIRIEKERDPLEEDAIHVDEQNVDNIADLGVRFLSAAYKLIFDIMGVEVSEDTMSRVTKASVLWTKTKDIAHITTELWSSLYKIAEMLRDFAATGDYKVFLGRDTDLVLAEATFLLDSDKYIRTFPKDEPELTYEQRIERSTNCVRSLRTLKFRDTPSSIIFKLISELNEKIVVDKRILDGSGNHHRPLCVYIFGETATGKTNLCNDLNEIACAVCARDTTASNTLFMKNANDETDFIEGRDFNPSCVVTAVIDEIGSQQPKPGVKFPFRHLFEAVQDNGWVVNRAFDKSNNVMYNNLLVLLSNSSEIRNLNYWVNNGDAAINRIDYSIEVRWKDGYRPAPGATRGAGFEDPENNRVFIVGKHVWNANEACYTFVPFSNEDGPTHRFTTATAFKLWFKAALDSQFQNGRLFSEVMQKYRKHERCAIGEVWLVHGAPCCAECDWKPPPKSKIDTGMRVVPRPEGSYVSHKNDVRETNYHMEERPQFIHKEQNGIEVPYWLILLGLFLFILHFKLPTKEFIFVKLEELLYEFAGAVLYRNPKRRVSRLVSFVKDRVLNLEQRKRNFLLAMTVLINLGVIYGATRPLRKQENDEQMDAKFRAAQWPCNEDRPEWYTPPPDPTKQEWGMKKLVYTPERILGDKINAVQSNIVRVTTEIGSCWGIYIRPNVVLTVSHNIPKERAVGVQLGGRNLILPANSFSFHPTKDLVLIVSPDIRANTTLLFERCLVRETRKQYCTGKLILKNEVHTVNWRPTQVHVVAKTFEPGLDVHFQKEYVTMDGDCGGVAINEAGEIFGIHVYSGGGALNINLEDVSLMLKGCKTGELESGGMVLTAKTQSVLAASSPPSDMNPFKADPLTIPIAKLPEPVHMNNSFETKKALAYDYFVNDLISEAGEDFAKPDSHRKFDPKLGYKVRGEERALVEMNNKGAVHSVVHAQLAMDYLIAELAKEPEWTFLAPMNPCELAKHLKGGTSAGYPWKATKNGLLDVDKLFPEEYEKELIEILSIASNDVVVGFSSMALKDEARKASKVAVGDIRIFEVLGCVNSAGACLVVPLILEFRKHPKFGFMVGLNCVSKEWGEMYNDLARRGLERAFFMDGKKYDKHMSIVISREVARFVAAVAKHCGYSAINIKRVYNICMSAVVRLLRVFGEVALVTEGNPSGSFMTTFYNMIAMLIFLVSTFQQHYPDKDFFSEVTPKLFGDDSLGTVNVGNEFFNQISIRDHCAMFFGQEFTSGRKDGKLEPFENLNEGVFLKRSFNFRDGLILCPLDRASIFKMMCWRTPSRGSPITDEEHFVEVSKNALKEAYLHSREFYDYMLQKINVVKACHDLAFDVPTYAEIDALYEKDELVVWDA